MTVLLVKRRFYANVCATIAVVGLAVARQARAGETELTPSAMVQVWATAYDADVDPNADPGGYGDPEADMGFSIPRARLALDGRQADVAFRLEIGSSAPYDAWFAAEAPTPTLDLQDAWVAWAPRYDAGALRVTVGQTRAPIFREEGISSRELTFQERGVASAHLAPGRDLGVLFDGSLASGLRLRTGVFNGGGSVFGDDDDGLLGVLRAEWAKGNAYRTWDPAGDPGLGFAATGVFEQERATRTIGAEADLLIRTGGFCLLGEGAWFQLAPTAGTTIALPEVLGPTSRFGATGQLGYTFALDTGGVELAARYSTYDDAMGVSDNGDVGIVHGGVTWHDLPSGVDLGAGYILRLEQGGRSIPNDTVRVWLQVRTLSGGAAASPKS